VYQLVEIVTSLSIFCPQNEFMFVIRISEQTAIISVVLVIETECVYCAVRSEPLNVIQVNQGL
jgi:hypothetical protein